jgi:hypothetical protein
VRYVACASRVSVDNPAVPIPGRWRAVQTRAPAGSSTNVTYGLRCRVPSPSSPFLCQALNLQTCLGWDGERMAELVLGKETAAQDARLLPSPHLPTPSILKQGAQNSQRSVVVFRNVNMDLPTHLACLPPHGETLFGNVFPTLPRGKAANPGVAATRLGAPLRLVGSIGQDAFGQRGAAKLCLQNGPAQLSGGRPVGHAQHSSRGRPGGPSSMASLAEAQILSQLSV